MLAAVALGLATVPSGAAESERRSGQDPYYLYALAQQYRHSSDFQRADETFAAAVELEPDAPYLRLGYAEFLYQAGKLDRAAEQAAAARRLLPGATEPWRLSARIEFRRSDKSEGAIERALQYFRRLRQLDPEDVESRVSPARVLMAMTRFDEAAVLLEEAFEIRPDDGQIASMLVEALERSSDRGQAESVLRRILLRDSDRLRARLALANLLSRAGRHGDAVAVLEAGGSGALASVEVLRVLTFELYRVGAWDKSLAAARRWIAASPEETPARYLLGLSLMAVGDHGEAERVLRALAAESPTSLDMGRPLAQVLERQGRWREARDVLLAVAAAAEAEPDEPASDEAATELEITARDARIAALELLLRVESWQEAVATSDVVLGAAVLDSEPGRRTDVRLMRAQALAGAGRADEALALFAELAELAESADRAVAGRAEALVRIGRSGDARRELVALAGLKGREMLAGRTLQRLEFYEDAIPVWRGMRKRDPDSVDIQFWLAAALERTGRIQAAEREFRELLTRDAEFAPALNYLGYMFAESGRNLNEAMDLVQRAVELEPNNGAYVDSLGWAYFQLGRLEEAREALLKAVRLVGDDAVVHEHLGDVYRAIGDPGRARSAYEKALELDADNAEAVRAKLEQLGSGG